MPIYEYRCLECGEKFEKLIRSINSTPQVECPKCSGLRVEKVFSVFGTRSSSPIGAPAAACSPVS